HHPDLECTDASAQNGAGGRRRHTGILVLARWRDPGPRIILGLLGPPFSDSHLFAPLALPLVVQHPQPCAGAPHSASPGGPDPASARARLRCRYGRPAGGTTAEGCSGQAAPRAAPDLNHTFPAHRKPASASCSLRIAPAEPARGG